MHPTQAQQIDLRALLRHRLGGKMRLVPPLATALAERIICQKRLNECLRRLYPRTGVDFCRGALEDFGISVEVRNGENLPADGRALFVSNHPLGGIDGIAILAMLGEHYGTEPLFVVNDLLMAIEPLRSNFIPVNKLGRQHRDYPRRLGLALDSDTPVAIFPAGLCSRRRPDGSVADLPWNKTFILRAIASRRNVVPLYFHGLNSRFFYNFAHWRKRLGIKANLEMVLLPGELLKSAGSHFAIAVGKPVEWEELTRRPALAACDDIRRDVYSMAELF